MGSRTNNYKMMERKEENSDPNTTIVVDTPQKVSKENFEEDLAQLNAELAMLSVKSDRGMKNAFIRVLEPKTRKILTKLKCPGKE